MRIPLKDLPLRMAKQEVVSVMIFGRWGEA